MAKVARCMQGIRNSHRIRQEDKVYIAMRTYADEQLRHLEYANEEDIEIPIDARPIIRGCVVCECGSIMQFQDVPITVQDIYLCPRCSRVTTV